jgi:hypothetical protein
MDGARLNVLAKVRGRSAHRATSSDTVCQAIGNVQNVP